MQQRDRIMMRYKAQNTQEWKNTRERLYLLTASEVPDAIGAGVGSRQKLYKRKMAKQKGVEYEENDYLADILRRGHEDEGPIVQMLLEKLTRMGVIGKMFDTGIWAYDADPRIGASPDRRFRDLVHGAWTNVEIKSRQHNAQGQLTEPRKPTLENWVQMQVQLQCTKAYGAVYACANLRMPERPMVVCFVRRSDEAWQKVIYPACVSFLNCLSEQQEPKRLLHKPDSLLEHYYDETVNDCPPDADASVPTAPRLQKSSPSPSKHSTEGEMEEKNDVAV